MNSVLQRKGEVSVAWILLGSLGLWASETRRPPFQQAFPPASVRVQGGFWGPWLERCRTVTIPQCLRMCEKTGRLSNFRRAAGKEQGGFQGLHFNDSDVYKIVEGGLLSLRGRPDPVLARHLEEVIGLIAAAQEPDGYLDTFFSLGRKSERFTHIHPGARHELYCMGHLIEAAVTHWEVTGSRHFLAVACKLADLIGTVFGPGKKRAVPEHQELELALIRLFRATGTKRYLQLARFFMEERGNASGHKLYGPYSQDHLPIRSQKEIVGHAVRAMYNLCGVADLYAECGDRSLFEAVRRLWRSATQRKMYVTGGVGATRRGEAFGPDWYLPNETAYSETCAQIGLIFLAHRLFLLQPEAEYVDVLQRVLYNGFLSGISLSGDRFFYQNRLAGRGRYRRKEWYACACCPSNVVRVLPQVGSYAYAACGRTVYVNLYMQSTATFDLEGTGVTLRQKTRYPWEGKVELTVQVKRPARFTVALLVPRFLRDVQSPGGLYTWQGSGTPTTTFTVVCKGRRVESRPDSRGFLLFSELWHSGDRLSITWPLPLLRVYAHPKVVADQGRVALARGPLVFCFEQVDNPAPLHRTLLPKGASLSCRFQENLLGGTPVIHAAGCAATEGGGKTPVSVTAIPYHLRDNRGSSSFLVWIPEDRGKAK